MKVKSMRRVFAFVMAFMLLMSISITAFAVDDDSSDVTCTAQDAASCTLEDGKCPIHCKSSPETCTREDCPVHCRWTAETCTRENCPVHTPDSSTSSSSVSDSSASDSSVSDSSTSTSEKSASNKTSVKELNADSVKNPSDAVHTGEFNMLPVIAALAVICLAAGIGFIVYKKRK